MSYAEAWVRFGKFTMCLTAGFVPGKPDVSSNFRNFQRFPLIAGKPLSETQYGFQ